MLIAKLICAMHFTSLFIKLPLINYAVHMIYRLNTNLLQRVEKCLGIQVLSAKIAFTSFFFFFF